MQILLFSILRYSFAEVSFSSWTESLKRSIGDSASLIGTKYSVQHAEAVAVCISGWRADTLGLIRSRKSRDLCERASRFEHARWACSARQDGNVTSPIMPMTGSSCGEAEGMEKQEEQRRPELFRLTLMAASNGDSTKAITQIVILRVPCCTQSRAVHNRCCSFLDVLRGVPTVTSRINDCLRQDGGRYDRRSGALSVQRQARGQSLTRLSTSAVMCY